MDAAAARRIAHLHTVTKRLIVMTLIVLGAVTLIFSVTFFFGGRLLVTHLVFCCGIIGGFVSIQQRIKKIGDDELELIASSWFQICLIPVFGGVFALVLYAMFLGDLVQGDVFPEFAFPDRQDSASSAAYMVRILVETYPASGEDLAKVVFWGFVAGFSERFVPQIVSQTSARGGPPRRDE